jgi:ribosomal protein S18 acetylase RimI-like enzyme
VLSDYRQQGHAIRLMEAALAHALSLRLEGVRLLFDTANTAARRLYEKLRLVERHHILCER